MKKLSKASKHLLAKTIRQTHRVLGTQGYMPETVEEKPIPSRMLASSTVHHTFDYRSAV